MYIFIIQELNPYHTISSYSSRLLIRLRQFVVQRIFTKGHDNGQPNKNVSSFLLIITVCTNPYAICRYIEQVKHSLTSILKSGFFPLWNSRLWANKSFSKSALPYTWQCWWHHYTASHAYMQCGARFQSTPAYHCLPMCTDSLEHFFLHSHCPTGDRVPATVSARGCC